jgi:hypothetical protein
VSAIAAWHDYFITVAQISATLAGLLFVGVTISLNHMLMGSGYLYRAWAALFLQFEMLVVALFALIPGQTAGVLGGEFVGAGLSVLAAIRIFGHYFPEGEHSKVLGSRGARIVREILIHLATLLPAVAGILLIAGAAHVFGFLVPAEIISLYLSFGLAWVFAVEIPRRLELEKSADHRFRQ